MFKKLSIVLLVLAFAGLVWAKDVVVDPATLPTDMAPNINRTPTPNHGSDLMWDIQFDYNIQDATPPVCDDQLLGCEYDGNNFWVTGGGGSQPGSRNNTLYKFNDLGVFVAMWEQATPASDWGWRDLAYDGAYLYGACSNANVAIIDPNSANPGTPIGTIAVVGAPGGSWPRAIAYDPGTDHFYGGSFDLGEFEFNRQGQVLRTFDLNQVVYGMAWDVDGTGGPWLWMHCQNGGPPANTLRQVDPVTLTLTGVSHNYGLLQGNTDGIAGGAAYTQDWDPQYSSMIVLTQGTPKDRMAGLEMYQMANLLAPGAPTNFVVNHNNAILMATLSWVNPSVMVNGNTLTDLDGVYVYRDNVLVSTIAMTAANIGQPYSTTNVVPAAGLYNYRIQPFNNAGPGLSATGSNWIGLDMPAAPSNVVAVPNPLQLLEATITWTAPTAGAHGGYFPAGSWTGQKIYRNGALAATLTGTNTSYVDYPPIHGYYIYGVSYYNASGEGPAANAPEIYVGQPEWATIPYDWVEINTVGTNTGITQDDQNLGPFNIGFNFPWYENVLYSTIRVCSNGFLSFTSTATTFTNATIPTTAEPNNLVAPYWDDLYPPGGGTIWYYYDMANDRFIVEYDHVMSYLTPRTPQTFEAILHANGDIDFMYATLQAPCINTGTVGIENGTGTVGVLLNFNGSGPFIPASGTGVRIYAVGFIPPPPDVSIVLTPATTPIVIPPGGGSFNFNIAIANNELTPQTVDIWTMITLPSGNNYGPIINVQNFTLAAGFAGNRDRTQNIPGGAPAGAYVYHGYVGQYPDIFYDQDEFPFTKSAIFDGSPYVSDWANWGENFEELVNALVTPEEFALHNAYPNPFNPATSIMYDLPEASNVKLVVYDLNGRIVANLVDGWMGEGSHSVVFNADNLPSGVYFCSLTAGNFTATKKLLLIK